jgi:hypothetical protein
MHDEWDLTHHAGKPMRRVVDVNQVEMSTPQVDGQHGQARYPERPRKDLVWIQQRSTELARVEDDRIDALPPLGASKLGGDVRDVVHVRDPQADTPVCE